MDADETHRLTLQLHPNVAAWLREHAEDGGEAVAEVIERLLAQAFLSTHPREGPCSGCGGLTIYTTPDLACSSCRRAATLVREVEAH
jgi:hypothetical protein